MKPQLEAFTHQNNKNHIFYNDILSDKFGLFFVKKNIFINIKFRTFWTLSTKMNNKLELFELKVAKWE